MRVLIVDDDPIALGVLRTALVRAGYDVATAPDGQRALELLKTGGWRFVISDWDMPFLNGLDLCRAVRSDPCAPYVYFILLTSHSAIHEIVEGLSAGADDFIVKPFNPAELIVRVRAGERLLSLETRDLVIFSLARLAESRDKETGEHLERVRNYSRILAEQLAGHPRFCGSMDDKFIRLIYETSPLHDIGKVGIPDSILLKPGRLTPDEFEVMKTHTILGRDTLDAALEKFPEARFLQFARDIAATHHERFDGTGYPLGLAGDEIPLSGRIVALADVYDALTSKRPYKDAFDHEKARSIILDSCGTHFDPDVIEAFRRREEEFISIRERYSEEVPCLVG